MPFFGWTNKIGIYIPVEKTRSEKVECRFENDNPCKWKNIDVGLRVILCNLFLLLFYVQMIFGSFFIKKKIN